MIKIFLLLILSFNFVNAAGKDVVIEFPREIREKAPELSPSRTKLFGVTVSNYVPKQLKLYNRLGGETQIVSRIPKAQVSFELNDLIANRAVRFDLLAGVGFQSLYRKTNADLLGTGVSRTISQEIGIIDEELGLQIVPHFLNFKFVNAFVAASVNPYYGLTTESAMDQEQVFSGMLLHPAVGMMANYDQRYFLRVAAFQSTNLNGQYDLSASGLEGSFLFAF